MKIEASVMSTSFSKPVQSRQEQPEAPKTSVSTEPARYSELAQKSKFELTIDEKEWIDIIERANRAISGATCSFEYSIHKETKEIMIKVFDKDSGKVIREIPPEKVLDMVARMWEMAGILVDERR